MLTCYHFQSNSWARPCSIRLRVSACDTVFQRRLEEKRRRYKPATYKLTSLPKPYSFSQFDYCNCLLIGAPSSVIQPLQKTHPHCTSSSPLYNSSAKLHWLPFSECIKYKASTAYGMEISAKETKLMTNNTSGINTEIKMNGQKLETVTSFKYLGSVITDEGSKPEILSRIAQTTAALTRLKPVWIDKSISLNSKITIDVAWKFPTHWDLLAFRGQTWVLCVLACWFFSGEGGRSSSASHGHFQCLLLENFMLWQCSLLTGSTSSLGCTQSGCSVVHLGYAMSIFWMPCDNQKYSSTQDH